jgi:hypothetical protein
VASPLRCREEAIGVNAETGRPINFPGDEIPSAGVDQAEVTGNVEEEQAGGPDAPEDLLALVQLADSEFREVHQSGEQDSEE